MAFDKVVDSAKLDAALKATADSIRAKTGGTEEIPWDADKGFSADIDGMTVGEALPDGAEITFGYTKNEDGESVPVEREERYGVESTSLNEVARITQEMVKTEQLMTIDDIAYWLGRVKPIQQGAAYNELTLGAVTSFALGEIVESEV